MDHSEKQSASSKSLLTSDLSNFIHKQRLAIVVFGSVGLVSFFLPWVQLVGWPFPPERDDTITGFQYFGATRLGFMVAALFGSLVYFAIFDGNRLTPIIGPKRIFATIATAAVAAFGLYFISALVVMKYTHPSPTGMRERNEIGIGLILWTISGVALVPLVWLLARPSDKSKSDDDAAKAENAITSTDNNTDDNSHA